MLYMLTSYYSSSQLNENLLTVVAAKPSSLYLLVYRGFISNLLLLVIFLQEIHNGDLERLDNLRITILSLASYSYTIF